ncbi:MAG TPA: hypothetical protein VII47_13270 [Actinomycetota bacterium]|jgi:hypothetical protein
MLLRDLAAVCGDAWAPAPEGHALVAPKGSRIVAPGPDSGEVVAVLRSAGPKVLQVFALALDLWAAGTGGRNPSIASVCRVGDFSQALAAGPHGGRDHDAIRSLLEVLGRVRFECSPQTRQYRSGNGEDPGPPLRLHPAPPGAQSESKSGSGSGSGSGLVAFSPGPAWVRGLAGSGYRVARLPRSFLGLHARNDRYRILLSWYVAIMLRVNRKHGFRYRVGLRTLLEGAGIGVPDRNVSRFLAAILRALEDIPDVRVRAPAFALYDPAGVLDSMVDVWLEPALIPDYAT